jgi:hypothetical protein
MSLPVLKTGIAVCRKILGTDLFGDKAHIDLIFKSFMKYYSISIVAGGFCVRS